MLNKAIDNKHYILGEYKAVMIKVEMRCSEGHVFYAEPRHYRNGRGCVTCSKEKYENNNQ